MHGILTSTANKYFHSTQAAGITHTPVLVSVNIPFTNIVHMIVTTPNTNYVSDGFFGIGEPILGTDVYRAWALPDFSLIPSGKIFNTSIMNITPIQDASNNSRVMDARRSLRNVVASEITWNNASSGVAWATPGGGNATTDYDGATAIGTVTQPASPTLNTPLQMTMAADELQKLYDGTYPNYGMLLFVATQTDDNIIYAGPAYPAYRPFITVTYWN